MDYTSYWGMSTSPFSEGPGGAASPLLDEALARLSFLVDERRPLGILVGEAATGKTRALKLFATRMARRGAQVVRDSLLGRQSYELLWEIGNKLGARPQSGEPMLALWNALELRISELALDRARIVILLDDVDGALGDAVCQIGRILALGDRFPKLISLILSSSPSNLHRLGARILQQAHLRVDLGAMTLEETTEFLRRAITRSGASACPFEPGAIDRLHFLTQGMPGQICRIADLALMVSANEKGKSINEGLIESIFMEFAPFAAA
jgi:type II secretory pathway predicted ATPase ExeA